MHLRWVTIDAYRQTIDMRFLSFVDELRDQSIGKRSFLVSEYWNRILDPMNTMIVPENECNKAIT